MMDEWVQSKEAVLTRIRDSRAQLELILAQTPEPMLTFMGAEGWSVKDHLAHIVVWESVLIVHHIRQRPYSEVWLMDAESAERSKDMSAEGGLNDLFYERAKDLSLANVLKHFHESYQTVLATLELLSDADVQHVADPDSAGANSLIEEIADNTYNHYDAHARYIRAILIGQDSDMPTSKDDLLQRVADGWDTFERTLQGLSEAQMTTPGAGGWSPKDNVAHLVGWEHILMRHHIGREPFHEVVGIAEDRFDASDEDGINAIIFERNKDRATADILAKARQTHAQVVAILEAMAWNDLLEPIRQDRPYPLVAFVVGNTYAHYADQLEYIRQTVGQPR